MIESANGSALPDAPRSAGTSAPSLEFLGVISHEFARRHLIPSARFLDRLQPPPPAPVFTGAVRWGGPARTGPAPPEQIAAAIDGAYARLQSPTDDAGTHTVAVAVPAGADLDAAVKEAERDLLSTQGKAPAVRL